MTSREAIQLAKRIERWRDRLAALGVAHWRIEAVHVADETPGGPLAKASVQPSHQYDHCTFWFTHDYVDNADDRELDETIIHEWLHVAMRGLDQAIESGEHELGGVAREVWNDRVNYEREGIIDRLAKQLYALWSCDAEATPAALRRNLR